jgi:hypothetical protein
MVWRERMIRSGIFLLAALGTLGCFATYNHVRYDDFTVSRNANNIMPLYRLWVRTAVVAPENGPKSRELAALVEQDLLTREPYRSRGVSVDEFFSAGLGRDWGALAALVDRNYGWDHDHLILRQVALEALRKHWKPFLYYYALDYAGMFTKLTYGAARYETYGPSPDPPPGYQDREDVPYAACGPDPLKLLRDKSWTVMPVVPELPRPAPRASSVALTWEVWFPASWWFLLPAAWGLFFPRGQRRVKTALFLWPFFYLAVILVGETAPPHYRLTFDPLWIILAVSLLAPRQNAHNRLKT